MKPEIVVAQEQPFVIEAMVFEEDTYRVLSAGNHIREIRQPLAELQAEAVSQQAAVTGELVVRGSRWFAILHDFDRVDAYQREAVPEVLDQMAGLIGKQQITSLAMQALGAHHGPDALDDAVVRIRAFTWPDCLARIWILTK